MEEPAEAPVAALSIEPHVARALRLATELSHPVYDRLDLALALNHDTHVITDDRRFAAAVTDRPGLARRVQLLRN